MDEFPKHFNYEYVRKIFASRKTQDYLLADLRKFFMESVENAIQSGDNIIIISFKELNSHSKSKITKEIFDRFPKVKLQKVDDTFLMFVRADNDFFADIISLHVEVF